MMWAQKKEPAVDMMMPRRDISLNSDPQNTMIQQVATPVTAAPNTMRGSGSQAGSA